MRAVADFQPREPERRRRALRVRPLAHARAPRRLSRRPPGLRAARGHGASRDRRRGPADALSVARRRCAGRRSRATRADESALPADWREQAALTRALGDDWLRDGATALLRVPSAIVPEAANYLLNPAHADAARIGIASAVRAAFDPRLMSFREELGKQRVDVVLRGVAGLARDLRAVEQPGVALALGDASRPRSP